MMPNPAFEPTAQGNPWSAAQREQLFPGEEWLLLFSAGHLYQCGGSSLLGGGRTAVPGMTASDVASVNAFYYQNGARWLELVRTVVAAEHGR